MHERYIKMYIDFLLGEGACERTIHSYKHTIKQFLSVVNRANPEDINKDDIQKFKTWCNTIGNNGKPYDRNTLIPKYSAVKIFVTEIIKKPVEWKRKLKPPKLEIKPKEVLTEDEIRRLFSASKEDKRDNSIIKTLYFTTIRRSELQMINIEDIDFENQTLITWGMNSKGNHHDIRNIHEIALKSIKEYQKTKFIHPHPKRRKGETTEDYNKRLEDIHKAIFLNRSGTRRIGKMDLSQLLKRYGVIAGITKRIYPHLLRSSGATHLSNGGMSLPEIQAQTKHRSMETLVKHYINPNKERVKKAYTDVFNQFSEEETPTQQIEVKQTDTQPTPQSKPKQDETDKTDKYIAWLNNGKIDETTFLKLVSSSNKDTSLVGYM